MNEPIRVAQVIGIAINGGVESFWMNYYRHIDRNKVQFDFLVESTSDIIDKEEIEKMGGRVVIIPSYKNPIKYVKTLTKIFKENKYDIVHSNMNALSVFTLKAAKKAGVKVRIAHNHATTSKRETLRNLAKQILKKFSKKYATDYFAVSKVSGEWLFGKKSFEQGEVKVFNSFDVKRFLFSNENRKVFRNKIGVHDDTFLIGNIGRFVKTKNQSFLLEVFYQYQNIDPNSRLLICGEGPLENELKQKAVKLNIKDKVIFLEATAEIEKVYSGLDLYMFPSLYEGLGLTLLEAETSGLPCIASNGVSQETKVIDYVSYLDLNSDIQIWVNEIQKFKEQKIDREACGKNVLNSSFSIDESVKRLEKIYFELLQSNL